MFFDDGFSVEVHDIDYEKKEAILRKYLKYISSPSVETRLAAWDSLVSSCNSNFNLSANLYCLSKNKELVLLFEEATLYKMVIQDYTIFLMLYSPIFATIMETHFRETGEPTVSDEKYNTVLCSLPSPNVFFKIWNDKDSGNFINPVLHAVYA